MSLCLGWPSSLPTPPQPCRRPLARCDGTSHTFSSLLSSLMPWPCSVQNALSSRTSLPSTGSSPHLPPSTSPLLCCPRSPSTGGAHHGIHPRLLAVMGPLTVQNLMGHVTDWKHPQPPLLPPLIHALPMCCNPRLCPSWSSRCRCC